MPLERRNSDGDRLQPPFSFQPYRRFQITLQQVWTGFRSLNGSPSELWKAYTLKFLDSYAYFSFSIIFTLFLSSDFGYDDVTAGAIYGVWGALITVYGLATGFVVDNLGVATSLRLGFAVCLVARFLIFYTSSRTVLLFCIYFLLPLGNCLGIPVLTIGIRRYTVEANRGFAFGLFYVIMNVAALLSGPTVDLCTKLYKPKEEGTNENRDDTDPEWSLTGYRLVMLTCIGANVIAVFVTMTVREIKLVEPLTGTHSVGQGEMSREEETNNSDGLMKNVSNPKEQEQNISTFTPLQGSAWSILKETVQARGFWRYLVVILITINVRMIFRHLDSTLPKYMIREFGENVPYGTIYSINPAIIVLMVPLVTAATSHIDPLVMIHWGTYVSAASVFFLAVSTSVTACIFFVMMLSIGEAIWSPRLYDYTISVCPEGREGTYSALSSAPLFLAKLPVGLMSGYLLHEYCPEEGPRRSKLMWLIIGATTATSPILMTVFWKFISQKDNQDDDARYTELPGKTTGKETEYKDVCQDDNDSNGRCIT